MPVPLPVPPLRPTGRSSPAHDVLIPWPAAVASARAADAAYLAADRELAAAQEASVVAARTEAAALADDDALAHLRPEPTQEEFDAAFPPDPTDDDREAPEDADEAAPAHEYDGPTYDELPWWTFR